MADNVAHPDALKVQRRCVRLLGRGSVVVGPVVQQKKRRGLEDRLSLHMIMSLFTCLLT